MNINEVTYGATNIFLVIPMLSKDVTFGNTETFNINNLTRFLLKIFVFFSDFIEV